MASLAWGLNLATFIGIAILAVPVWSLNTRKALPRLWQLFSPSDGVPIELLCFEFVSNGGHSELAFQEP